MDDPFFSPESLLSPDRLFGAIVEWRSSLMERSSVEAFQALDAMREIHPVREYHNRKLFMSSVARETDILGGVIESEHDPQLVLESPVHYADPEVVASERAHIEYINAMSGDLMAAHEATIPDELAMAREARARVAQLHNEAA